LLNKVGCKALVTASGFKTSDYVGMLRELAPETDGSARGKLCAARLPALRTLIRIGSGEARGFFAFKEVLEMGDGPHRNALEERGSRLQFDDPINIQFTSGTTGFPKGATLTHHNILNNGYFNGEAQRLTEHDRVCIPVPLYHCFGMVMGNLSCITHGAAMVYPSEGFDPLATLEAVAEERCTALYGVPTMFIAELGHPEFPRFDLSSLRTGVMAGAPCPIEVMKRCVTEMKMREITIGYGMTETSPLSTQTACNDSLERRVGTVGRGHPHVEIKIVDADGGIVPRSSAGEFCTRGYSVMLGYWDDEKTAQAPSGRLDAYRRSRHHGPGRLLQHRWPPQGHGDPRGRKHLSARNRGVLVPPSQHRGGAGHRRPRRSLRRRTMRLDQAQGRRSRDSRRDSRLLQGPDRALQDSSPHSVRERLPHDGDRKGAKIHHARRHDQGIGAYRTHNGITEAETVHRRSGGFSPVSGKAAIEAFAAEPNGGLRISSGFAVATMLALIPLAAQYRLPAIYGRTSLPVARKLISLWRLVRDGVLPDGVILRPAH
jgi:acyl-CoA synthetase (AMP-forming)/AMP-acid ligase II